MAMRLINTQSSVRWRVQTRSFRRLACRRPPEMIFGGTRLFSVATRVLVNAMESSAVRRLICITGFGAGDSRGRGGFLYNAALCLILSRIYADKDAQEWIIRRSQLDWTIVRPTILTDGRRTGAYRVLVVCFERASACTEFCASCP